MKAMLLAAGKGERMMPLTATTPKPLLLAGGKPLIVWHLEKLKAAGFTDLVINHAWLGEQLESTLGSGEKFGVHISYSPEGEPLETAGGIIKALPQLGSEPFLVISADVWTDFSYRPLHDFALGEHLAHLVMVPNAPHHPKGDFVLKDGRLALVSGFPDESACTYSGIGIYSPAMFAGQSPGKLALRPLLSSAFAGGRVSAELYTGQWRDIGTPERLEELDRFLTQ